MNYYEIHFHKQTASLESIEQHLRKISANFTPPLDSYININEYARKIHGNAITFEAWNNNELVALAGVYFNNQTTKIGYCTILTVIEEFQSMGIGKALMKDVFIFGKINGFLQVDLEVNKESIRAKTFYKKLGFIESEEKNKSFVLSKYLNDTEEL